MLNPKHTALLLTGLFIGAVTATTVTVFADGDPTTDAVPRAIPYQGMLELDGQPVHASGEDAILVEFALYDDVASETPVYTQRIALEVYAGRFTATIGPLGDDGTPIEEVIQAADGLLLGMTLLGEDPDDPSDDIAMTNRQRIMASPYAMWTTSATNLTVAANLTVGGDATLNGDAVVGGDLNVQGVLNGDGAATQLGGDLRVGVNDGHSVGNRTGQRALSHDASDTLVVNAGEDFEGGTRIDGDVIVTGNLRAQGVNTGNVNLNEPNYAVTHTGQGSTMNLNMERITALCGDGDGCGVRIGMIR